MVNSYSKPNECAIAPFIGIPSLKEEGGDLVIIANEPAGQVVHYLFGEFGKCGEGGLQLPQPLPTKVKRMIILSPFKDQVGACFFGTGSLDPLGEDMGGGFESAEGGMGKQGECGCLSGWDDPVFSQK